MCVYSMVHNYWEDRIPCIDPEWVRFLFSDPRFKRLSYLPPEPDDKRFTLMSEYNDGKYFVVAFMDESCGLPLFDSNLFKRNQV